MNDTNGTREYSGHIVITPETHKEFVHAVKRRYKDDAWGKQKQESEKAIKRHIKYLNDQFDLLWTQNHQNKQ